MNRILFLTLLIPILFISLGISSCGNSEEKIDPEEYKNIVNKLDEAKELQSSADKELAKLREEIDALEIEKQRLIAEKKRLEADVIDLKIKDRQTE